MSSKALPVKVILSGALVSTFALLLGFNYRGSTTNKWLMQGKFQYDGTNALYIKTTNGLEIKWITQKEDTGYYALYNTEGTQLEQGKTRVGKVHSVALTYTIKKATRLEFGGINEPKYTVTLRPKSTKTKSVFTRVDSLYVVGDVHGRYNQLIHLLQKSQLVDKDLQWTGGKAHLVFLGDLFDRGNDVTKLLWFIYELEEKAEIEGGKVHLVLGNHEIMTMTNDLRYLGPKEAAIAATYGVGYNDLYHPVNSLLGNWLSNKPSVLKIDKALLAHGGIVDLGPNSIHDFNTLAISYMKEPLFLDLMKEHADSTLYDPFKWKQQNNFFFHPQSPYWYRGYVQSDTLDVQLTTMLKKYRSNVHVVAHTPVETITQKYKGKLLTTDLKDAATQLLLMVRNKNTYIRYKIDSEGERTELN